MGSFVVFIAFLLEMVVNICTLSDVPIKNVVHWFPVDFSCTSLKVQHRNFMGLFYRVYCVALTRYC